MLKEPYLLVKRRVTRGVLNPSNGSLMGVTRVSRGGAEGRWMGPLIRRGWTCRDPVLFAPR